MAKAKKKMLPKEFDDLLQSGDIKALKAVFDSCDVDARGGYSKQTALAFNDCPDELARWLVEQGADIAAEDSYGETPLHSRSGHWQGKIEILLELGADVNHQAGGRGTPLHCAAAVGNKDTVTQLLAHGADPNIKNAEGLTPLAHALSQCNNAKIVEMSEVAEILVATIPKETEPQKSFLSKLFGARSQAKPQVFDYRGLVTRIGETFEFHRAGYNPASVDKVSTALERLYVLFDVPPVPRRSMHDGKAPILVKSSRWEDQHQELWELLVPSSGAASTVQGELVRVSGRIHDEIYRNGGVNWDRDYHEMTKAFSSMLVLGNGLPNDEIAKAQTTFAQIPKSDGDTHYLCKLAVDWVSQNPKPIALAKPNYSR